MSDMAKKARAAMKSKAKSLTTADPHQKVDSSTWTPPEPLNADVKTGLRPLSRRAFKSGGKVQSGKSKVNLGKATRGGNKPITPDTMANKDVKAANMDRPGIKHVGGMKKGGAACGTRKNYADRGFVDYGVQGSGTTTKGGRDVVPARTKHMSPIEQRVEAATVRRMPTETMDETIAKMQGTKAGAERALGLRPDEVPDNYKKGGRTKKLFGGYSTTEGRPVGGPAAMIARNKGGRAKKMLGGPLMNPDAMIGSAVGSGGGTIPTSPGQQGGIDPNDPRFKMVSPQAMNFGVGAKGTPYKKGGMVKHPDEAQDRALFKKLEKAESKKEGHEDEAMDKALIRKMVKPSARTGKAIGGAFGEYLSPALMAINALRGEDDEKKKGGRVARASGGATKGKSNIRINIMTAPPAGGGQMLTPRLGPMPPPGASGGRPVPIPAPGGGALPTPMPMPVPIPMGGAPMAPAGGAGAAPMARKSGGRISKVAKSYKDMEAGAGSGEGRLQKTDIAKRIPKPKEDGVIGTTNLCYPNKVPGATGGRTAHKAGGRTGRDLGGPTLGLHGTRQKAGKDFMPVDEALWLEGEKKSWSDPSYNKGQGPTKGAANRGELLKRKAGGRTYRSYKDMDAGAGSGMGRLEKSEIQARKG